MVWLINKMQCSSYIKLGEYLPKPYGSFGDDISVKLDFSNYATKTNQKRAAGADTSNLAAKSDLAILKAEVDKIDVEKLKTVSVDLSCWFDVVKKNCVWIISR